MLLKTNHRFLMSTVSMLAHASSSTFIISIHTSKKVSTREAAAQEQEWPTHLPRVMRHHYCPISPVPESIWNVCCRTVWGPRVLTNVARLREVLACKRFFSNMVSMKKNGDWEEWNGERGLSNWSHLWLRRISAGYSVCWKIICRNNMQYNRFLLLLLDTWGCLQNSRFSMSLAIHRTWNLAKKTDGCFTSVSFLFLGY